MDVEGTGTGAATSTDDVLCTGRKLGDGSRSHIMEAGQQQGQHQVGYRLRLLSLSRLGCSPRRRSPRPLIS